MGRQDLISAPQNSGPSCSEVPRQAGHDPATGLYSLSYGQQETLFTLQRHSSDLCSPSMALVLTWAMLVACTRIYAQGRLLTDSRCFCAILVLLLAGQQRLRLQDRY